MKLTLERVFVNYQNHVVGLLEWDAMTNFSKFTYDVDFINSGIELSPILMPLSNKPYQFEDTMKYPLDVFKGLPPMISDSLPDAFGNIIMRNYLEKNNIQEREINTLFRLSYIGNRGIGALEYEPVAERFIYNQEIDLEKIQALIRSIYEEKLAKGKAYTLDNTNALDYLMNFGASVGGARPKMFIALDTERKKLYAGDTAPQPGLDYYLIKINNKTGNSDNSQYGKVEFAYYQMAKECGIEMMDSFLWNEEHFCTKRFDRDSEGNKFHYQTFNSMFGASFTEMNTYSYEQFFTLLKQMNLPQEDLTEFYRRMCFNVIAMNRDDHTKNFALILKDKQWRLAPAYDLCYSYDPNNVWVKDQTLSVNWKRQDITAADLIEIGENYFIKNPKRIVEQIKSVIANFSTYANQLDIAKGLATQIDENIQHNFEFTR